MMFDSTMAMLRTSSITPTMTKTTDTHTLTSAAKEPMPTTGTTMSNWITKTATLITITEDNNNHGDANDSNNCVMMTTTSARPSDPRRNDSETHQEPPPPPPPCLCLETDTKTPRPSSGPPGVQTSSSAALSSAAHSTTPTTTGAATREEEGEETRTTATTSYYSSACNSIDDGSNNIRTNTNDSITSNGNSYRTVNNENDTNTPTSSPRARTVKMRKTTHILSSSSSRPFPGTRDAAPVSDADGDNASVGDDGDGSGDGGGGGSAHSGREVRRMRTLRPSSNPCLWLLFLELLSLVCVGQSSATWWFIGQLPIHASGTGVLCDNIPGLVGRQKRLCRHHPDVMVSLAEGARLGVRECQYQFQYQRWNCSTLSRDFSVFGKVMLKGSREAAFVYAISAAGVVHAITRACSKGQLHYCACDPTKRGKGRDKRGSFDWGGCSDNVRYGSKFSRMFIDAKERKVRDPRALMNLHNNRAGRRAVKKFRKLECKCHGVSGSCTIRSCWLAMQEFRKVGNHLKTKHNGATQVMINQEGTGLIVANRNHKRPTRSDLVYFEKSPDYCVRDPDIGSLGTAGRTCNKTSMGTDGCDIMCCGRGYDTKTVRMVDKCECKFHWCCFVVCKECRRWVDVHTCKGPPEEELYKAQQRIGSNGVRGKYGSGPSSSSSSSSSSSASSSSGRSRADVEGNTFTGRRPKRQRLS